MSNGTILTYIAIGVFCTLLWRILPFAVMGGEKRIPDKVQYLGKILPPAIMAVLIVYCLKEVPFSFAETGIQKLLAVGIVAGSYLWKKNSFISIALGTGCYMLLLHIM